MRELLADLGSYFPSNTSLEDAPLSGVVFKLEKEATGEKVAYVRVFSGSMRVRTSVNLQKRKHDGEIEAYTGKIQKLHVFWEGKTVQAQQVGAGEFCKVWGLKEVKVGDVVGGWSDHIKTLHFATPKYETRIEAVRHEQDHQLYQVLLELAEEDPLISVLKDDVHQTIYLRIFGEVQAEPSNPASMLVLTIVVKQPEEVLLHFDPLSDHDLPTLVSTDASLQAPEKPQRPSLQISGLPVASGWSVFSRA